MRLIAFWFLCGAVACTPDDAPHYDNPLVLGGQTIDVATLNEGRVVYLRICAPCHGLRGDGMGPVGRNQQPPPRDLRLGYLKFAAVPSGALPRDEDFRDILKRGLKGTGMLVWPLSDREIDSVTQYIKAFAPRFRKESPGQAVRMSVDPIRDDPARRDDFVARGREVYHQQAQCSHCHPNYNQTNPVVTKPPAPDFRKDTLRWARHVDDFYRVIAAGIGGTQMPTWKDALPEDDLWALSHYVRSLVP